MVLNPIKGVEVPSAIVTLGEDVDVQKLEHRLGLPVIWSRAPKSKTHFEVEERRHLKMLTVFAMAVMGVEDDVVNDS